MLRPPRAYTYLDAVVRAGSIRKAAENLNVASTAVNRKIIELEEQVGTPLFERLPRGVRLTAAGEVLLDTVRRSLSDLRSATSQIEQLRGLVRGTVRWGCAESVASDFAPRVIQAYQQTRPGVRFQVLSGVTNALIQHLMEDEVDLVLAHDPQLAEGLKVLSTIPQPLCAMVRPDHPLAGKSSLKLADCQDWPLALGLASFGSRRLIDALVARTGMSLKIVLEASTMQTLKEFTLRTGAISFQYEIGTQLEARRGELVSIPLTDRELLNGRLVLVCREGRMLPIAAMSFIELLSARLHEDHD